MKKSLAIVIAISMIVLVSCVSAPPPRNESLDKFVSLTGINAGKLTECLYVYGDSAAGMLSKRIINGRDTIDIAPDSETYIIKYVQGESGRMFLIPKSELSGAKDKESYIAVILQYSTEMSATNVDYSMAFAMMFNMARTLKKDKNVNFPEWIEVGLKMNDKELENYRIEKFTEDKYVFSFK